MDVSENRDTPKSSILIGFSIINHPFWGTHIFGNTHIEREREIGSTKKNGCRFQLSNVLDSLFFFSSKTTPLERFFIVGGWRIDGL